MSTPARISFSFVLLLGLLVALTSLGTDTVAPALPALSSYFSAGAAQAQLVMSAFFLGIALGQVVWGPLSDRFGRKPVLMAGMAVFLLSSAACAVAPSAALIVLLRIVQGLGMSSGSVIARAVVRDLFDQKSAAKVLAQVLVVFGLVPILSPLIGGHLLALGWQAIFAFLALTGLALLCWIALSLEETAPPGRRIDGVGEIGRSFAAVFRSRIFILNLLLLVCAQCGLFAFITNSPLAFASAYGLSATEYSAVYSLAMSGWIAGAWLSSRMVARLGVPRMLRIGSCIVLVAGLLGGLLAWGGGVRHWAAIAGPCLIYILGVSWITPNAIASAQSLFAGSAGTVSSAIGATLFLAAAAVGVALGLTFDGSVRPMATVLALGGMGAFLLDRLTPRNS